VNLLKTEAARIVLWIEGDERKSRKSSVTVVDA
jgi:hypothetical protein